MFEINKKYSFFALVEGINKGDTFANITVVIEDNKTRYNIKVNDDLIEDIIIGKVYYFNTICLEIKERIGLHLISYTIIYDYIKDSTELEETMQKFYDYAPVDMKRIKENILKHLNCIENSIIKEITTSILEEYKSDFYLYPAAMKYHHAYIGGLAYHTSTMLELADGIISVYPYINKDLVYAGIILHDITKTKELTSPDGPQYSKEGQLIGHLVLGALEVSKTAFRLGYEKKEEVIMLEHIIISSHGLPQFGAAKKPMTSEALLVWFLDTMDSKFTVLGEEFESIDDGFTSPINVLDKLKFYKPKL